MSFYFMNARASDEKSGIMENFPDLFWLSRCVWRRLVQILPSTEYESESDMNVYLWGGLEWLRISEYL